jgi:hypothetical protein
MKLTRAQSQAFSTIRTHFRETGCAPSLGDMERRLKVSRQRAHALKRQLRDIGLISYDDGIPLSIRLITPMGNFSDDDLLCQMTAITEELVARGVDVATASVSVSLKTCFPLTNMELPNDRFGSDILGQMEGGDVGCGEDERGFDAEPTGGSTPVDATAAAITPRWSGEGGSGEAGRDRSRRPDAGTGPSARAA